MDTETKCSLVELQNRGWTNPLIEAFLGSPEVDETGSPLYDLELVEVAEQHPAWRQVAFANTPDDEPTRLSGSFRRCKACSDIFFHPSRPGRPTVYCSAECHSTRRRRRVISLVSSQVAPGPVEAQFSLGLNASSNATEPVATQPS